MKKNSSYNLYFKRIIDFIASALALIVFFPVMLLVAIGIKIDSPGAVIFKQTRLGLNQKEFSIFKFRSMVQDASKIGNAFTSQGDKRITKMGSFLRKTSLDELPQLFNVLIGDMSIVGPRPDLKELAYMDNSIYKKRFDVRPGITGMAQALIRSSGSLEERCSLDARYVDEVSLFLDLKLIVLTAISVIKRKNTN